MLNNSLCALGVLSVISVVKFGQGQGQGQGIMG
jgi:hypothetical protein